MMEVLKSFMQAKDLASPSFDITSEPAVRELLAEPEASPRGYAYRRLSRFKVVNGKRYQLHATRGWKCVGRAS